MLQSKQSLTQLVPLLEVKSKVTQTFMQLVIQLEVSLKMKKELTSKQNKRNRSLWMI
jgi:hypothetical protein